MSGPTMNRLILVAVTLSLSATLAPSAYANGRFPAPVSIQFEPGNPDRMYMGVTFGLLVSDDGGQNFRWVCEQAIGYGGTFDPDYAIAPNGDVFATTFDGLRRSGDRGCTWDLIQGPLATHWVGEVEIDRDGAIWAATSSGDQQNDVFVSTDGGGTFLSRGLVHPTAWWRSMRVAPGDTDRVYVTGFIPSISDGNGGIIGPFANMYRTVNGGSDWTELDVSALAIGVSPQLMIMGVDPNNADVLFVRSIGANEPLGDALYRSIDGGQSFVRVLDTAQPITAFLIESGGDIIVGTINDGVYRSTDGGDVWAKPAGQPQMGCLGEREDGVLFACGANWEPDYFALGRSDDRGQSFTKIVRFNEVREALHCPVETIQFQVCEAKLFGSLCEQFGCNNAGGDGGVGGDGGAGADGGNNVDGGGGGCCDAGGAPMSSALLLLCCVVALARPRRRRG